MESCTAAAGDGLPPSALMAFLRDAKLVVLTALLTCLAIASYNFYLHCRAAALAKETAKLNKSEQARRELEIQISNGTAREEEFHLAFSRAKEQTEAREHYFADLKLQLDELRNAYDRDLAASNEEKNDYMRKLTKSEEEKEKIRLELKNMKTKETERREKELTVKDMLQDTEHKLIELKTLEEKVRGQSQALHLLFGQWHKDYFLNKSQEEAELENYFLA